VAIYMKFGSINGPVTTKGYEKWIECNSFQFGVGRSIGTAARGSTNREGAEPHFSEVTVTKPYDVASVKLMEDGWAGHLNTKVTLSFTSTSKGAVQEFLKVELEKCGVSGYSVSAPDQGNPSENISLNYAKITVTHTGHDAAGGGSPMVAGYNLEHMKTS